MKRITLWVFSDEGLNVPKGFAMRTKSEKAEIPQDKIELYDRLIATNPDIERKGAGVPYTSVNGHMFTFMYASGSLGIRLPEPEREAFIKKYDSRLFKAYGTILKEYVEVPDDLLKNTGELKKYLDLSFSYAMTLKPKPQKKAKATAAKRKSPRKKQSSRR